MARGGCSMLLEGIGIVFLYGAAIFIRYGIIGRWLHR